MSRQTQAILLLALLGWAGTAVAVDRSVRWKTSVDISMTQPMSMKMPTYTDTVCGPAEPQKQPPPMKNGGCQMSDYKSEGERVEFKVVCDMANGSMTGDGWSRKVDADHYEGHMDINGNAGGMPMAMAVDYKGTRVGSCSEAEAASK